MLGRHHLIDPKPRRRRPQDYKRCKLHKKPANVLFDRICLNNGINHILTAPYSPTTTGKTATTAQDDEKGFFSLNCFATIALAQAALDDRVRRRYALPTQSVLGQPNSANARRLTGRRLAIPASTAEKHRMNDNQGGPKVLPGFYPQRRRKQ